MREAHDASVSPPLMVRIPQSALKCFTDFIWLFLFLLFDFDSLCVNLDFDVINVNLTVWKIVFCSNKIGPWSTT